ATIVVAQDYVKGKSLRTLLGDGLERATALGLFIQIAHALAALHQAGIAHRDLKPENVIVDLQGRAVVIDFGLASLGGQHSELEMPRGTAGYAAPELWAQGMGRPAEPLLDVYAFGIMLREALPGIDGKGGFAGLFGGGDPLTRLVRAATSDDPARRPQSMQEIAGVLGSALSAESGAS
ncbi:MAG: protein kinase, partial [Rhizobiaceae bacterium]